MKRSFAFFLSFLLYVIPTHAQFGLDANEPPKLTAEASVNERTGDTVAGVITATVADGWHVNSNKPSEDFAIPTVVTSDDAELVSVQYPAHVMRAFQFTGGKELAVYEGTFTVPFTAKLKPGATGFTLSIRYQPCSDTVCMPPSDAKVSVDATKITAAPAGSTAAPASSGGFTPLSEAPKDAKAKSSLFSSDVGGTLASRGLPLTLFAIFLLGLALNLTPCVYPLIPITIGYFSQQSGSSRGRRVALSALYVLGIAITYSILGVFSALSGKLFGAWLQHPAVLIFFAVLMLVMASSMFGLFEMQAPRFISNRSGGQSGLFGALMMGLVIGIVAAPCVGPFVISLIALVSSLQSPFLGFLMFFVLAIGLGVPYLLLGIFSSGASAMPRAGMWMITIKKAMGFILIAMAFYFLRPLTGDLVFQYGVAASLIIGALLLFFTKGGGATAMRIGVALLLLVAGIFFAIPKKHEGGIEWKKYEATALAQAKSAGKPVVIDFYADWCLPCKELDEKTFSDPRVGEALGGFERFKADLTSSSDAKTIELTKQYAIKGVPTIVFLDASGKEVESLRLTGFEPPDAFLARVAKVK